MPRRKRDKQDLLSQILDKTEHMLGSSPLSCIYRKIEEVILPLQRDIHRGFVSRDVAESLSIWKLHQDLDREAV